MDFYAEFDRILTSSASGLALYAKSLGVKDADEAVQEAFVRLWEKWQSGRRPENPSAWLFCVVRNEAFSAKRRLKRLRRYFNFRRREKADWFEPTATESYEPNNAELTAALGRLEPVQREALVARIWGNLTFDEIARLLQIPRSTAHYQYAQAIAALKKQLTKEDKP